jgi:hypothetical protein
MAFTSDKADEDAARSVNPHMAMSCEGAPPETYLQNFQIWDGRVSTCAPIISAPEWRATI